MEPVKLLLETLERQTYELFAVFLPGATLLMIVAALRLRLWHDVGVPKPSDSLLFVVAALVMGRIVHGVANLAFVRGGLARLLQSRQDEQREEALEVQVISQLQTRGIFVVDSETAVGICLSHLESRRAAYDKFIALTDMAREMAVALLIGTIAISVGSGRSDYPGAGLLIGGGLVGCIAFGQLYTVFQPLPRRIVYTQYLDVVFPLPRGDAPAHTRSKPPEAPLSA
jgi:hypothetical protein